MRRGRPIHCGKKCLRGVTAHFMLGAYFGLSVAIWNRDHSRAMQTEGKLPEPTVDDDRSYDVAQSRS